ncbi:phosphoribosylglycinamide formyltransferase [Candidatus Poribacteria bacterium]|nr:phosphoribosylglycinamide formyltransferase [Candidatus Poribacteria bacterium]
MRIAVLASGNGSNLQALIDRLHLDADAPVEIAVVVSDRKACYALERARAAGIPTATVRVQDHVNRDAFDAAVEAVLREHGVELIVLAGFMRVFQPSLVRRYRHRIVNIHPALLPSFPGTHGIRDAFEYGVRVTGVTVHFVDEGVDTGPIIGQVAVSIESDDTEDTLAERIHAAEHQLLPEVVRALAEGRVCVDGRRVRIAPPT